MKPLKTLYKCNYPFLLAFLCFLSSKFCNGQTYCIPYSYYGCGSGYEYGTLERTQLKDAGGKTIFDKAANGCNASSGKSHSLISSSSQFTLYGGSQYALGLSVSSTSGKSIYTYSINASVWIDYDRDGNFSSSEYISNGWTNPVSGNGSGVGGAIQMNNFTVPCGFKAGVTRMRIITYLGSSLGSTGSCPQGGSSSPPLYYGEQEDYTVTLAPTSGLSAGFNLVSNAFVGTPVKLTNKNQTGYISYQWDIDANGSIDYTTTNASHTFKDTGKKCIRLLSYICSTFDSALNCILIINPTAKPDADFISDQNKIERFGTIKFTDMSTNGPTSWHWYMYDPADSANTRKDLETFNSNLKGSNPNVNANPSVIFSKSGNYTVCLTTTNGLGNSTLHCKNNYILVSSSFPNIMGASTIQPIYSQEGDIIDDGGSKNNYTDNSAGYKSATIIPCSAKKITLTFSQFKLDAGDYLRIYDGTNTSGKPLHTGGGFTKGNVPTSALIAYSGAMYIHFSTNGSGNDEGFIASWKTEKGTPKTPVADFVIPDTLYTSVTYNFLNTSINVLGKTDYVWRINPTYNEVAYTKEMKFTFIKDGTYSVNLTVNTCTGSSSFSKDVYINTTHSKVKIELEAKNLRPILTDTVGFRVFNSIKGKALDANKFLWVFSPNTVSFVNGTSKTSEAPQVVFNAKGKYTVSLCAWNTSDSAATYNCINKNDYVIVLDYCEPNVSTFSSTDIAINNVTLIDRYKNTLIENYSGKSANSYDDYSSLFLPTIFHGGSYEISLLRNTTANKMNRKVWIDFNIDGDFDDAGELVASEAASNNSVYYASFIVPDCSKSLNGRTKMRIGVSYNTDPNAPCGASSGITNANRIGEFEDYTLIIADDGFPPVLTINGNDTVYIETGGPYIEYGATAIDTTEGNISSRVFITSNVRTDTPGVYKVQYYVIDASCQEAIPVSRLVYVKDDITIPQINLIGADSVFLEVISESYTEAGATATDNKDGNLSNNISINGAVNSNKTGFYIITYSVKDKAGNSNSKQRIVKVRDSKKPIISNHRADTNNLIKVQVGQLFTDSTKVIDNYDSLKLITTYGTNGNVNPSILGIYTLTYNATDHSGNKADTRIFKYKVDDYIAPTIVLRSLDTLDWPVNKSYQPIPPLVYDNYYDSSKLTLTNETNVNPFKLGLYYHDYTATDNSGNTTFKRCWVRVVDNEAPIIKGGVLEVALNAKIDVLSGLTVLDNYDAPTQLISRIKIVGGTVDSSKEGVYYLYLQVTDFSGNTSHLFERVIWVKSPTSTQKSLIKKQIEVYPNPSQGVVYLSDINNADIGVYNTTGLLIESFRNVKGHNGVVTLDLSALPSGVYFLTISGPDFRTVRKVSIGLK